MLQRLELGISALLPNLVEPARGQLIGEWSASLPNIAELLDANPPSSAALSDGAIDQEGLADPWNVELNDLHIAYGVMRNVLFQETTRELGRPLTMNEVLMLSQAADAALRGAALRVSAFHQKQMQQAVETQSKYLSFLSHDLRGGLNGILLMVEVIKRELSGKIEHEELLGDLEMMRGSIMETVGTMDRFLHAERFRKGKVQLKPADVNIHSLMHDTANQFQHAARDKGVALMVDGEVQTVRTDREMVNLILQNLIGNAVKYSRKGSVRVTSKAQNDGTVRIVVADEGPGIPPDIQVHLFAPYTRGDTHGQKGTGLGLFIARQAADLLKAKIWVKSEVGKGSEFGVDMKPLPAPTQ